MLKTSYFDTAKYICTFGLNCKQQKIFSWLLPHNPLKNCLFRWFPFKVKISQPGQYSENFLE